MSYSTFHSETLIHKVVDELNHCGYIAWDEEAAWEEEDDRFILSFENLTSKADNVLVLYTKFIGFVTKGDSDDYIPAITAEIVLLDKSRKNILYQGYHAAGWQPRGDVWKFIPVNITVIFQPY